MDKEKSLRLMRFWLFGTFVILFTATTIVLGLFVPVVEILKLPSYWLSMGLSAALCAATFYGYRAYISRKS